MAVLEAVLEAALVAVLVAVLVAALVAVLVSALVAVLVSALVAALVSVLVRKRLIISILLIILGSFCAEDFWEVFDTQCVIDQACCVWGYRPG